MPRADIKAAVIGGLAARANTEVLNSGRSVVAHSSKRWRRVTDGSPCGFCAMLAGRGPVYRSAEKAGSGYRWHGHCGCTVEPYEGDPNDWEPTPGEQRFIDAYDAVHQPGMSEAETSAKIQEWLAANPLAAESAAVAEDVAAAEVDWLYESVKADKPADWASEDLQDFYTEAVTANDPKAIKWASDELTRRERQEAGYRGTGYTRAELRARYEEYVDREWMAAEEYSNGFMVNDDGRRAGVTARGLFTGSEARAYRYATDEVKYYWQDHPRLSFDGFIGDADAMGQTGKSGF